MTYAPPIMVAAKSVAFVRKLFPGYKRRDVTIQPVTSVTLHDLNWSGGTRSTYAVVRLDDMCLASLDGFSALAPWNNPHEGATVELRPGFIVVETGTFCGKPSLMRIYAHPDNLTPLLGSGREK